MILEFATFAILFVFGTILGSYINSWMWRIHEEKWKWGGRSLCVHCGRQLAWYENVPLFSYLFLKGKCRTCQGKIPSDYFWVELATGILFVFVAWHYQFSIFNFQFLNNFSISQFPISLFRNLFFTALLVVVFVYDLKYQIILTGAAYGGAIVAAILNIFILRPYTSYLLLFNHNAIVILGNLAIGATVGGGFFLVQYLISKGRWIGGGDIRFGVLMGALLGWPNILVALFVSYILGAAVSVPLVLLKKKGMESQIPFGTFLAIGTFVAMLWGMVAIKWYLGLLG